PRLHRLDSTSSYSDPAAWSEALFSSHGGRMPCRCEHLLSTHIGRIAGLRRAAFVVEEARRGRDAAAALSPRPGCPRVMRGRPRSRCRLRAIAGDARQNHLRTAENPQARFARRAWKAA